MFNNGGVNKCYRDLSLSFGTMRVVRELKLNIGAHLGIWITKKNEAIHLNVALRNFSCR